MTRRPSVALACTVLVVLLLVGGCGSSSPSSSSTSTGSTTTSTTAGSTTTTGPATTSTTTTPATGADTAVWPFADSATRYADPVAAATGFATGYLGFAHPVVGAFQQGDTRSGEVPVKATSSGPVTTVMVRQLGTDGSWSVLGASSPHLQLESPAWNATITSPVTLAGQSTAFEATVNVEVRQDGTLTPLAAGIVMGGSNGQMGPFSKEISFPAATAKRGAIVLKTLSAADGTTLEASVLQIRFP